jgi:hypothetical protein
MVCDTLGGKNTAASLWSYQIPAGRYGVHYVAGSSWFLCVLQQTLRGPGIAKKTGKKIGGSMLIESHMASGKSAPSPNPKTEPLMSIQRLLGMVSLGVAALQGTSRFFQ